MREYVGVAPIVVLALGVCFLALARARDDEDDEKARIEAGKKAAPDVERVADALGNPEQFKKLAEELGAKHELESISWTLKPREKGGLGVGAQADAIYPDAIELKLLQMGGRKGITAADFNANKAAYQRIAEIICAVAEATPYYGAKYARRPGQLRRWNAFANDMRVWGHELRRVVKAKDVMNLQTVARKLNQSCSDCHASLRDGPPLTDVEKAADAMSNPVKSKELAAEMVRLYDLEEISLTFKPRAEGGLGFGPKRVAIQEPFLIPRKQPQPPPAPEPESIEAKLLALVKQPPTAAQLAAMAPDLKRMAEVVRAIAEATPDYGKEFAMNAEAVKTWGGFSDDMKQGSDDLIAAVKDNDVKGLQKALERLNQSCKDCHGKFR